LAEILFIEIVIVIPLKNNNAVFNNGIEYGFNIDIPIGGHSLPKSIDGTKEL